MARKLVLYVEDEADDVLFMRWAFKRAGLEQDFQVVVDGKQAIDYLAGNDAYADRIQHPLPSMVLLDLNLPVVSGFDVLKWMREQPALTGLPVVIFSSSARPDDQTKASALGANAYLEKPGSALDFVGIVQQLKERWLS